MAKTLFILNDPSYGTERSYNALRLASSLVKLEGEKVCMFLIGEGAACDFTPPPHRRSWDQSSRRCPFAARITSKP
jgi:hypothetical protein